MTTFKTISKNDPAIDLERSNFQEFIKTGDLDQIVFLANSTPTFYYFKLLSKRKYAEATDYITQVYYMTDPKTGTPMQFYNNKPGIASYFGFQNCVFKVENLVCDDDTVKTVLPKGEIWSDNELDDLPIDYATILEIGAYAMDKHVIKKNKSK